MLIEGPDTSLSASCVDTFIRKTKGTALSITVIPNANALEMAAKAMEISILKEQLQLFVRQNELKQSEVDKLRKKLSRRKERNDLLQTEVKCKDLALHEVVEELLAQVQGVTNQQASEATSSANITLQQSLERLVSEFKEKLDLVSEQKESLEVLFDEERLQYREEIMSLQKSLMLAAEQNEELQKQRCATSEELKLEMMGLQATWLDEKSTITSELITGRQTIQSLTDKLDKLHLDLEVAQEALEDAIDAKTLAEKQKRLIDEAYKKVRSDLEWMSTPKQDIKGKRSVIIEDEEFRTSPVTVMNEYKEECEDIS